MKIDLKKEITRTNPDYVAYFPKSPDGSTHDTGNEHFLVFNGSNGNYMAVWTQSTHENSDDHQIVFATSDDKIHWCDPQVISGNNKSGNERCSFGFPIISKGDRIYVIYNKHTGSIDYSKQITGKMAGVYSDDNGRSWSEEELIPMPKSQKWDTPDPEVPSNWIVWQIPERLSNDKYFVGFTRWVSPAVRQKNPFGKLWWGDESVVEFMRFENIDNDPEVKDIEISWFAQNEDALQIDLIDNPGHTVAQEPSIVKLPDKRLFCVMRTTLGCPYYILSSDAGETWSISEPLRFEDGSNVIPHPISPCPIYDVGNGEYLFFYHNHDGHFGEYTPIDTNWHRRPIVMSRAKFAETSKQALEFSDPEFIMDNAGVKLGIKGGRTDLAMYSSMTVEGDTATLWYPDRKFFLLGKNIDIHTNE